MPLTKMKLNNVHSLDCSVCMFCNIFTGEEDPAPGGWIKNQDAGECIVTWDSELTEEQITTVELECNDASIEMLILDDGTSGDDVIDIIVAYYSEILAKLELRLSFIPSLGDNNFNLTEVILQDAKDADEITQEELDTILALLPE